MGKSTIWALASRKELSAEMRRKKENKKEDDEENLWNKSTPRRSGEEENIQI